MYAKFWEKKILTQNIFIDEKNKQEVFLDKEFLF